MTEIHPVILGPNVAGEWNLYLPGRIATSLSLTELETLNTVITEFLSEEL